MILNKCIVQSTLDCRTDKAFPFKSLRIKMMLHDWVAYTLDSKSRFPDPERQKRILTAGSASWSYFCIKSTDCIENMAFYGHICAYEIGCRIT